VGEKEDIKRRKERQIKAGKGEYWRWRRLKKEGENERKRGKTKKG
jgi:hypothetical protein